MSALRGPRARLSVAAALAGVATSVLLLALKAFAAVTTNSVAVLGSLADSALDLAASLLTLFGVRLAAAPADHDHRFGHGKAEALTALAQVALIAVSAAFIAWRAVERLAVDAPPARPDIGIAVSLIAIVVTFALLLYQRHVVARTGSVAIAVDALHYKGDLLLNLSVIAALVLEAYGGLIGADPLFGVLIALWLGWSAVRAASVAIDQLMDKEWPDDQRRRFVEVAGQHPELKSIHDLRTRRSGQHDFAQFHIHVARDMTVAAAHEVVTEIEAKIAREFPDVEVLIHLDPEGQIDKPGNRLVETDAREALA